MGAHILPPRSKAVYVRLYEDEHAKLVALSLAGELKPAELIRRLLAREWRARYGGLTGNGDVEKN